MQRAGVPAEQREELLHHHVRQQKPFPPIPIDLAIEDGQTLDGMEFIHTPGHSPGHVCIAVGDVLLCGDHILPHTMPQQWPECVRPYTGLGHYLESLEKVRRRGQCRVGLGGHEPTIEDLAKRIDDIERSQWRRLDRLVNAPGRGRPSADRLGGVPDNLFPK